MNLILSKNNKIIYFIKNLQKVGSSIKGDNIKLDGLKLNLFDFKYTLDEPTPIVKDEVIIGYKESTSDISDAPVFLESHIVDSPESVDKAIKFEIAKKYSIEDELKLVRRQDAEFEEYNKFVENLVKKGKTFKKKYFKKDV